MNNSLKLDDIKDTVDNAYRTTDQTETDLADDDYIPFVSGTTGEKKKIAWEDINRKVDVDPVIPIDPETAPVTDGAIWITTV